MLGEQSVFAQSPPVISLKHTLSEGRPKTAHITRQPTCPKSRRLSFKMSEPNFVPFTNDFIRKVVPESILASCQLKSSMRANSSTTPFYSNLSVGVSFVKPSKLKSEASQLRKSLVCTSLFKPETSSILFNLTKKRASIQDLIKPNSTPLGKNNHVKRKIEILGIPVSYASVSLVSASKNHSNSKLLRRHTLQEKTSQEMSSNTIAYCKNSNPSPQIKNGQKEKQNSFAKGFELIKEYTTVMPVKKRNLKQQQQLLRYRSFGSKVQTT